MELPNRKPLGIIYKKKEKSGTNISRVEISRIRFIDSNRKRVSSLLSS